MANRRTTKSGDKFGHLTIVCDSPRKQKGKRFVICQCDCGNIVEMLVATCTHGSNPHCGCQHKLKSYIGNRYGRAVVIEDTGRDAHNNRIAVCQCDCGNTFTCKISNLTSGNTTSCGCYQRDYAVERYSAKVYGKRFGRLVVLSEAGRMRNNMRRVKCLCDCGNTCEVFLSDLLHGMTKSCGCYRKEISSNRSLDIAGNTYNELTAIEFVETRTTPSGDCYRMWKFRCSCGREIVANMQNVKRGFTKSCGHIGASYGESQIAEILNKLKIPHVWHDNSHMDLVGPNGGVLEFDFSLFDKNGTKIFIEYQGRQHYMDFGNRFGDYQRLYTDDIKKQYCAERGCKLFEIRYDEEVVLRLMEILDEIGIEYDKE